MAATGYSTLLLYASQTAGHTPSAANLTNSAAGSEVAINIADGLLFYKDPSGSVKSIGSMIYPGAGIPNSTGSAWGTSYSTTGTGTVVALQTSPLLITPTLSGALIDNSAPYLTFANGSAVTVAAGRQWYNGTTGSWNLGMGGGNITQQVGEELFIYGKASSAISGNTILQAVYQTGTVGASGVVQFAPTVSGITNSNLILGVATEDIASNGTGRITTFGVIHGINTSGSTYSETWVDGDVIWYNPITGGLTHTKPAAPNIKVQLGIVINAGSGGSGSFQVLMDLGSVLGGTDSNVQLTSVANNNLLQYDSTAGYWKNVAKIPNSNLQNSSITINGTSVALGGTATISGGQYFGNAAVKAIAYNAQTIAENVTVTSGNNGLSAGPITVNNGYTVTVESGANWVIV